MVATMTPAGCGMAGCSNPVDRPNCSYVTFSVDGTDTNNIQITVCDQCRKRLDAPHEFNFYSMN